MKPVVFHPDAKAEMLAAGDYYDACCPGLGREFTDRVEDALARMSERPQSFAVHESSGSRKCVVDRFPYRIFFIERREDMWVVAVAHASRRPDYWNDRLDASP